MYDRNAKSKHILTKLCAFDSEYIYKYKWEFVERGLQIVQER